MSPRASFPALCAVRFTALRLFSLFASFFLTFKGFFAIKFYCLDGILPAKT